MGKENRDSKKRIAFPIQLFGEGSSFAELPDEIHVVPTGKWQHPMYGEMEITSADVAEFVRNFKDKVRRDLPITAGHDNGMNGGELPAVGWFRELIDRGVNGLYAVIEWTEEGKRLLGARAFKYFSPEFYEEYDDPQTHEVRHHVLVGGALTNKPYFKELDPVVAFSEPGIMNQFNEPMDLQTILAKKAEELTDEEQAFLRDHQEELTDEQKTTFASALEEEGDSDGDEDNGDDDGSDEGDGDGDEGDDDGKGEGVHASERNGTGKKIVMSEAEVAALREAADKGTRALQKIEANERKALIDALTFSQSNMTGRFYPKQEGALEKFLKTLSEPQRDAFVQLVKNMPKADASLFSEIGDGGAPDTSLSGVAKEVQDAVQAEIKASDGKLSYSAALRKVFAEKPDLNQRYQQALEEGATA